MAHHQHHGPEYEAQVSRSLQSRPTSTPASSMPIISEDEALAEVDEPPDYQTHNVFTKHACSQSMRRQSLLTRALHTDSESHDEEHYPSSYFNEQKLASVSSASTQSVRSVGDFTSDDGRISPSTRASTPGSPRTMMSIPKLQLPHRENSLLSSNDSHHESDQPQSDEATVEAKLGRKRCIMFSCGKKENPAPPKEEPKLEVETKRPCMIKFACPFKASKAKLEEPPRTSARHLSPAPLPKSVGSAFSRRHRDSDVTIRNESPTTPRAASSPMSPNRPNHRRFSSNSDMRSSEASRFHEFASEEEEHEDWTEESTCYKTRLTVDDTLKKEIDLRKLAEECDEEEALEREMGEDAADDDYFSDDSIDAGFQSDDEDGFAESDDEDDDEDSDYEWWAPRRSAAASPYVGRSAAFSNVANRTYSGSSIDSSDDAMSPRSRGRSSRKRALPKKIRSISPDLPDSTDFVCGTLDEDRPKELAYMESLADGNGKRRQTRPQDIDPSFPLEAPGLSEDEIELQASTVQDESHHFFHGRPSDIDGEEELRGRRRADDSIRSSLRISPRRFHSPPPAKKSCAQHRSPAPHMLFGSERNRRLRSPGPAGRLTSPPPSRRGSTNASPAPAAVGVPFLGTRSGQLTHTASLPRSPHPAFRRGRSPPPAKTSSLADEIDDDEEGSATDRADDTRRYARGAIDICQGLERKRLKRREMFQRHYLRKEEKRERKAAKKRPVPGRGAERMRRECLGDISYDGTRMLSI